MVQTAERTIHKHEIYRTLLRNINGDRAAKRLPVHANLAHDKV
jgi:hypothetical protein